MSTSHCKFCTEPFLPTRKWSEFCSSGCRLAWHQAQRAKGAAALLNAQMLELELSQARNTIAELEERLRESREELTEYAQRLALYEPATPQPESYEVYYIQGQGRHRTPPQPISRKLPG